MRSSVAVSALVALVVAVSGAPAASAAGPRPAPDDRDTAAGSVGSWQLDLETTDGHFWPASALAEPGAGRLEVELQSWHPSRSGRYLQVGFGTRDGTACDVSRWVVLEPGGPKAAPALVGVYDAAGTQLALREVYRLVPPPDPLGERRYKLDARLELDPFGAVDCVRASGTANGTPTLPGASPATSGTRALVPVSFGQPGVLSDETIVAPWPLEIGCPQRIPYGGLFPVTTTIGADYDIYPMPSHVGPVSVAYTNPPRHASVVSPADPVPDVDLWAGQPVTMTTTLQADPAELYKIDLGRMGVAVGGAEAQRVRVCSRKTPVSHPVPTDWQGTLDGTTLWHDESFRDGTWSRTTWEFDDHWVYVGGRDGSSCAFTEDADTPGDGCYRYYYDEATQRLQLYDQLIPPTGAGDGWVLPYGDKGRDVPRTNVVLEATTGQRVTYSNRHWQYGQNLVLRADGTYQFSWWSYRGQTRKAVAGRYRFLGGDRQQLVLSKPGPDFKRHVDLYYGARNGEQVLVGLRAGDLDVSTEHVTPSETSPLD